MPFLDCNISGSICDKAFWDIYKETGKEGEQIEFGIKLADIAIDIHGQYSYLKEYCRDYLTDEAADLGIEITAKDILVEREQAETENVMLPYLETLAALRKIAGLMPEKNRFLMHGAALSWKGEGYMFTAPSGTGKSTHAALWKKYLGNDVKIINGDKPILKADGEEIRVYGTPWAGKERWQINTSVPLNGICILQRSENNRICCAKPVEVLPQLLKQVHYTEDSIMAAKTMELLDLVLDRVPLYQMECNISEEAVRCSFECMTGNVWK